MAEMNEQEQQSKEPIRSDMIVRDVILAHPDAAEVLMRVGMGCISCPAALIENLGDQAAFAGEEEGSFDTIGASLFCFLHHFSRTGREYFLNR